MALPDVKKMPPVTIYQFRNINEDVPLEIPELPENRKCTDIGFLIFFLLFVIFLICLFSVSSSIDTDYKRFLHGYDKCGDTCGVDNNHKTNINCSGKDLSNKPIMKYRFTGQKNGTKWIVKNYLVPEECVEVCEKPNRLVFHRCIPPEDFSRDRSVNQIITFVEFMHDLQKSVNVLILPMCITALVVSIGLFVCFYFNPRRTICGIFTVCLFGLCSLIAYVWYWFSADTNKKELLYVAIIATIIIFFLSIFTCFFHDKYGLVIAMFKETTQAIFQAPYLTVVPVVTLLVLYTIAIAKIFLACLICSNQYIRKVQNFPTIYEYEMSTTAEFGLTYLALTFFWLQALSNGCQCIVVAGPVSAHYFQKLNQKSNARYPVLTSCYILFRYHFGTVAFGSLCITIFTVARTVLNFFEEHLKCKCTTKFLQCCLSCLEGVVEYLTKRAYIQTAMHGKSLYKSGVRAARLLWLNLMDTIALDVVADFIMICATIMVILVAVGVAIVIHEVTDLQLDYFWTMLLVGAVACGLIVYFIMQIINIGVETIFICFCEDKLMNNGQSKPYFMSEGLKTLIDKAKKANKRHEET